MNLKTLQITFSSNLKDLYPPSEVESFFTLLSENYLNFSRFQISLNAETIVADDVIFIFQDAERRLKNFEPIQYIISETEFFGLKFKVNTHTLIPRPETEELVELILQKEVKNKPAAILDIGTGSGCIAIALAKNLPNHIISACDISEEALKVAAKNATNNTVEIKLFTCDILNVKQLPEKYDVIVSNPPYVRNLEKEFMSENVLKFEPATALFVADENALVFYEAITQLAKTHLQPNGRLFFEINEFLYKEMTELMSKHGFIDVEISKDIYGKNRMLSCRIEN